MVDSPKFNETVMFHDGKFQLHKTELTGVPAGKVLVKMAYSAVSHFDQFLYMTRQYEGSTLGGEGSGTIIQVGEGLSSDLVGSKVTVLAVGIWATYAIAELKDILFLDPSQDLHVAFCALGNPITALC
jgi:NADPH:quinone reductase-like Zn-dependent oxidoreductase